jgi:hypothetical protein
LTIIGMGRVSIAASSRILITARAVSKAGKLKTNWVPSNSGETVQKVCMLRELNRTVFFVSRTTR